MTSIFAKERFPIFSNALLQNRLSWSIRLRWLAGAATRLVISFGFIFFDLAIPIVNVYLSLAFLALANMVYSFVYRLKPDLSLRQELIWLSIHIGIDFVILTLLIHFTGGIDNPFYIFYIFHLVISSLVFPRWFPYAVALYAIGLFSALVLLEYAAIIDHYCIFGTDLHDQPLVIGMTLFIFAMTALTTTYICTTFMQLFRQAKRRVDRQNLELQQLRDAREDFFRYSSHELKSPIIAINTSLETVLQNSGDRLLEREKKLLERAVGRCQQMLSIVAELLQLNRNTIQTSDCVYLDIDSELRVLAEDERETAEARNIHIGLELMAAQKLFMVKDDFRTIFANLIGNAMRYTPDGGQIVIRSRVQDNDIQIAVADNGIGIDLKDQEKVFQEFYRSRNAREKVTFGTGLGLSLVKKRVQDYGGSIHLRSQPDQGSTFTIFFPLKGVEN
jgi:signal transduction histidine kinase